MTQQALYRKWRSRSFDELVGQPHVVQTLQNALETGRVAHAYLFSGARGTGKTSTARILAKVVNCLAPEGERPCNECHLCRSISDGSSLDLIEIDAASNTQVDKVRDVIVEKINFAPSEARKKVYIIDEIHMLSNSAFNALLKTIEEPPPHAMFILATTEIHKIPATILSRCQRLDFRRITVNEVADHLAWVLEQEGFSADRDVLELVARQSTGSMRDALSLLDQLLSHGGSHLTLPQARAALGLASTEAVQALVDHLLAQDVGGALALVNRLLDQGTDPRQFLVDVLDHLRALLLTLAGGGRQLLPLPDEALARLRAQARWVEPAALVETIRHFNQAGADLKLGLQPQLPLELATVEAVLALQARGAAPAPMPKAPLADAEAAPPTSKATPRRAARPPAEVPAPTPQPATTVEAAAPEPSAFGGEGDEDDTLDAEPLPVAADEPPVAVPVMSARAVLDDGPPPPPLWEDDFIPPPPRGRAVREQSPEMEAPRARPAPEAKPAPPVPTAEPDGDRSLGWWQGEWDNFKNFLTKQGEEGKRTALRLKFCEPHALDGDGLALGFFYSIHLEKVQAPKERAVVERGLAAFSGSPVAVRCVLVPKPEAGTRPKNKYEQAAEDPVVREALKLGARLVEVYAPEG